MVRFLVTALTAAAVCAPVRGQEDGSLKGYGYFFGAPGFTAYRSGQKPATQSAGGGAELLVRRGWAVGPEIAYMHIGKGKYSREYSMGVVSVNVSYHWGVRKTARKATPFVTLGYSHEFDGTGQSPAVNLGAGVQYWFHPRVGVRFEIRDTMANASAVCFRFGLAFR